MLRNLLLLVLIPLLIICCSDDQSPVGQVNGFISGRVTIDGLGIAGVSIRVSAYITTGGGSARPESYAAVCVSAADGDYRIELLPGKYRIDFDILLDLEWLRTSRYPVEVISGQETAVNVEFKDPTPANLIAVENDAVVELAWQTGYRSDTQRVYRSLSADNDYLLVQEFSYPYPSEAFVIDIPPAIDSYYYRVTSVSAGVESDPSEEKFVNFSGVISAPTGFAAIDLVTHVAMEWNEKANASLFKIYRAESSPENWVLIDSVIQNSFDDIPGSYGSYHYYITAVSPYGTESGPSPQILVEYDGRYDPPAGLTLIDRGSNLYLTWIDEGGLGYYNIYRSLDPETEFVKIDSTFDSYYEDVPLIHDHYYYRISIVGPNGLESDRTEPVGAFYDGHLDAPARVRAIDRGLWVDVEWSEVMWAGSYIVYRSDDDQTYHQIARISASNLVFEDRPPQAGSYSYKVSTETVDGVEGPLSELAGVYFTDNLSRPENVLAESFGTYIQIAWDPVFNATAYKIFRSTSSGGGYVELGTSTTTHFTDIPESAGPYFYKVRATDDQGHESPFSFYSFVYFIDIPLPPHQINVYDESFGVLLEWSSEDMSYDFIVYRSYQQNADYIPIDTVAEWGIMDWPSTAGHYYYKIQAMADPERISEMSDDVHIFFSGILGTPSNLQADTAGGFVSLTWYSVEGASEYDIYRGISENQLELIQTVYSPECTDAPAIGGTYYYAVTAKTQGGLESPRSAPIIVVYQP